MKKIGSFLAILSLSFTLAACAEGPEKDGAESLNRSIFAFNEAVDGILIHPAAQGYHFITPRPVRDRLSNASRNLGEPVNMLNAFLQGDMNQGFTSFWRFLINSTVGLAGMNDVASSAGLAYRSEDFGQTLAVWGASDGGYVVLPIFGPSSVRDAFGLGADFAASPWTYVPDSTWARVGIAAGRGLIKREQLLDPIDDIYATSLDPYATFRSIYRQQRESEIRNSKPLKEVN